MLKEKKIVYISIITMAILVLISLGIAGISLYNNWIDKSSSQKIYIVIRQYDVEDGHFKVGDSGEVIFKAEFTDELYYEKRIETAYGYNTVLIKDGVAKVIDADCPHPFSLNGCRSSKLTNDVRLFDTALIRCMQHGISIGWEVE